MTFFARSLGMRISLILLAFMILQLPAEGVRAQDKPRVEIVPQIPHSSSVHRIAFSPDNAQVLSGSGVGDGTVKLWDVQTGKLLRTFTFGLGGWINSVAFSPDGTRVLSGGFDRTNRTGGMKLWDAATGQLLGIFLGDASSVAFSPDGTWVLSGGFDRTNEAGEMKLWDAATGQLLRTFEGHSGEITSVAFSPDGTRVLSGSTDKTIKLWDARTARLLRTFERLSDAVLSVAFSPDGTRVVSGSGWWTSENTLKLWDAVTGQVLRTFVTQPHHIHSVAFSPDGKHVVSGDAQWKIKLWDVASGQLIRTFDDSLPVYSVAFSHNGMRVLSGNGSSVHGNFTDAAKLWDVASGQLIRTFEGHAVRVTSVAFSSDSTQLLSGGDDKTVKIWDARNGQLRRTLIGHSTKVTNVAFSPDGRRVLAGSTYPESTANLWDTTTGKLLHTFAPGYVAALAFSRDGARLVLSGDRMVTVWDAATGARLWGHESDLTYSVAFSPDGGRVLLGGNETIEFWDVASGQLLYRIKGHSRIVSALAFSPDGTRVLSGGWDNTPTLKLWDAATGQLLHKFEGHWDSITSITFSPDGIHVLSGSADTSLKLWDAAKGELIRTFGGHSAEVNSVAFSGDGRRIVSGSSDTTIRIWETGTGEQLVTLSATADGEWLAITTAGFFDASDGGLDMLAVVRGFKVFSVDQFRDQLQRKDLLQELLSGDVLRKYEDAASKLNLKEILDSGPTPTLELLENEIERAGDTFRIKVRIFNNERGGIGKKLIWRVNGQTQGETQPEALRNLANANDPVSVTQALKIDPNRDNIVTVTAYNGAELLATLPLRYKIDRFGTTAVDEPRPRMFIVAIGVDGYSEPALTPLKLAVKDVKALANNIRAAAEGGGYEKAEIIPHLEAAATRENIAATFADIAARAKLQDALIVLLAGHGKSVSGRYYYMPVNTLFGGPDRRNITSEGIPTETWQQWIASVQVDKKLLIIDTCESSDAVFITRGSREELSRETAVNRLRQSIGHSVITAARQAALEVNRLGHGVLTYAVLEGLAEPPRAGTLIQIRDLDAHVLTAVPRLSLQLSGQAQEPFNKIVGNFPIGAPQTGPPPPTAPLVQPDRYILHGNGPVAVRARPDATAEVNLQIEAPAIVQVFEFGAGGWVLIGRGDTKLGYVPSSAVQRLKE
jgi:WD40 repeat protein